MDEQQNGKEFGQNTSAYFPKEHFQEGMKIPKNAEELKKRLLDVFEEKSQGWVHPPDISTSTYLYESMGETSNNIDLKNVIGWTYFNNVENFLNEERSDQRGLKHILDIINGWNDSEDDTHNKLDSDGLTFISNEPGKYILNEGKHRFLAAVAMGISELPAKIAMYSRKPLL